MGKGTLAFLEKSDNAPDKHPTVIPRKRAKSRSLLRQIYSKAILTSSHLWLDEVSSLIIS
jgi:hypothetical protein